MRVRWMQHNGHYVYVGGCDAACSTRCCTCGWHASVAVPCSRNSSNRPCRGLRTRVLPACRRPCRRCLRTPRCEREVPLAWYTAACCFAMLGNTELAQAASERGARAEAAAPPPYAFVAEHPWMDVRTQAQTLLSAARELDRSAAQYVHRAGGSTSRALMDALRDMARRGELAAPRPTSATAAAAAAAGPADTHLAAAVAAPTRSMRKDSEEQTCAGAAVRCVLQ